MGGGVNLHPLSGIIIGTLCAIAMEIRPETPADIPAIYQVNCAAFGRPSEADLVDRLRQGCPIHSFVAVEAGEVVGHLCLSPVTLSPDCGCSGWGLAPVAVLPAWQRQGIGSQLVQYSLQACAALGVEAVFVLGDPQFYERFGFQTAKNQGFTCEYPVPEPYFMALELRSGVLNNCQGLVKYHPEFQAL